MNDMANRKSTAVAATASNPFTVYGDAQNQRVIVGQLLKFSKGDFLAGQDEKEVPIGTQFLANMDEMLVGWIRWQGNRPTDHVMGKVSDNYQAPRRNELGDTDREQWELDTQGQARDPWQFSNYLLLKDASHSGELFTFTTSSRGGLNALGELCKAYGAAMAQRPDEYPVIVLGSDVYDHPNRAFGRIKVPTFKIVGWGPAAVFADADAAPNNNGEAAAAVEQGAAGKKGKTRF